MADRTPVKRRAARRRLTAQDYQALEAFRHAVRKFRAFSEAGAEALGLTAQQHQALLAIKAHAGPEPMSVGELGDRLLIKNHSAVGLVSRLEQRGLVTRAHAAADRRRVLLTITAEAEKILETISRNNLAKLKSNMPVFLDLLAALEQLELPGSPEG